MTDFYFRRSYRGPIRLVVFDWAGTTVDHGSLAPAVAFVETFCRQGIAISLEQARAPMGMEKRTHIAAISAMKPVAEEWQTVHGSAISEADIDAMYADFAPLLLEILRDRSDVIAGTRDAVAELREAGIRIGATTGYFEEAMAVVQEAAAAQGYAPDCSVCAEQVPAGRPAPWMLYRVMQETGVYPPQAVVKVGDTPVDIAAGLNAGVWTVGVALTGNETGLSADTYAALADAEQERLRKAAYTSLTAAGAHYVVDGIADVPTVVREIQLRARAGDGP